MQAEPLEVDGLQLDPAVAALLDEPRWGIIPVLVWIATRDLNLTAKAASPGLTFQEENIGINLRRSLPGPDQSQNDIRFADLKRAWTHHLSEAMTKGTIRCLADRVSQPKMSGIATTVPGMVFPPADEPGAAKNYFVEDEDGTPSLVHSKTAFADTWVRWENPVFEREQIMARWPAASQRIAIWDFAAEVCGGDKDRAGRLVASFYSSFWSGEFGDLYLTLAQSRFGETGVELIAAYSPAELAQVALGFGRFKELGVNGALAELCLWSADDYSRLHELTRYYFYPDGGIGSPESRGRGLLAPRKLLQNWYEEKRASFSEIEPVVESPHAVDVSAGINTYSPVELASGEPVFEKQSRKRAPRPRRARKLETVAMAWEALWGKTDSPPHMASKTRNELIRKKIVELNLPPPISDDALQKQVERHRGSLGFTKSLPTNDDK